MLSALSSIQRSSARSMWEWALSYTKDKSGLFWLLKGRKWKMAVYCGRVWIKSEGMSRWINVAKASFSGSTKLFTPQ